MAQIFISYARSDGRVFAGKIESSLQSAGFTTWRDTRDLDPYQDFTAEIEQGINDASHVIACVTPDIKRSDSFVRRELQYAMLSKKRIIPLRFASVLPPIHIVDLTWIDFFNQPWNEAFSALADRLRQPEDAYERLSPSIDPYHGYLKSLYEQIVSYLQQTVFALNSALIELHAKSSPEAVVRRPALPLAFFGQAGIELTQQEFELFESFHEAFEHYGGRVLLLGDPGAGKTTTLLAFVRDAVWKRLEDPSLPLPITAPITTWDGKATLPQWLAGQIPLLDVNNLSALIAEGKLLLAFDGLDELQAVVGGHDERWRFLRKIPSNNQIVVSCRRKEFAEIRRKVDLSGAVVLQPLTEPQMRAYIGNRPSLWKAIHADEDLRKVAQTPLLLSLLAYAFNDLDDASKLFGNLGRGDLRDKIFETFVRRRYEHEVRKRRLPYSFEEMTSVLKRAAIRNAAYAVVANVFNAADFVPAHTQDSTTLIEQARLLHLIVQISDKEYRFVHLLLRDYFAFSEAMEALVSGDPDVPWEAPYALGKLGDTRAVEPLIVTLRHPDTIVRQYSADALWRLSRRRAFNALLAALSDPSVHIRRSAADALLARNTRQAHEALTNHLSDLDTVTARYVEGKLKRIPESSTNTIPETPPFKLKPKSHVQLEEDGDDVETASAPSETQLTFDDWLREHQNEVDKE